MLTELTFTREGGKWVSTFASPGDCVMQIARVANKPLSVEVNLDGMIPVKIYEKGVPYAIYPDNALVKIEVPEGLNVTVTSDCEVTLAKIYRKS